MEDADTLIANARIELSPAYDLVIIVGDVDFLVLLIALRSAQQTIYFQKPATGNVFLKGGPYPVLHAFSAIAFSSFQLRKIKVP